MLPEVYLSALFSLDCLHQVSLARNRFFGCSQQNTRCSFPFSTEQPVKHEVPYKTASQTASFQTKQQPKQNLVLVFAAVCQPISNRANPLEIQGELLSDEGKQLQTKSCS
jgi:hypothetical protein